MKLRIHALVALSLLLAASTSAAEPAAQPAMEPSKGIYRLPYPDETEVWIFDDATSHRPAGRIDLVAKPAAQPQRVVAAADGIIRMIEDRHREQQSGRAASECRNNFVWIEHPNGEWSTYSHLRSGSVTSAAGLKVGDQVVAGQFIGYEGAVGCAMLDHVHFEIAVPGPAGITAGGFVVEDGERTYLREPRFCRIPGGKVRKDATYQAQDCG